MEAQFQLNPIRLAMDKGSWPVGTKDYANLFGRQAGVPYRPNKPSPAPVCQAMEKAARDVGLL